MIDYSQAPTSFIKTTGGINVHSFLLDDEKNIDWGTVDAFGKEWNKFNSFQRDEITTIGDDYFDIVTQAMINTGSLVLDVGCGSGRWARYLSRQVKFIEAIDPSDAALIAADKLADLRNVRVTRASVDNIPFPDESFDFIYSLGVLHHIPDTLSAIAKCRQKLKKEGWILLYLYYSLDNRGVLYKVIFAVSNWGRQVISKLPSRLKLFTCDLIALFIYWPLSFISRLVHSIPGGKKLADKIPLSYYRKTSFQVMRNDSLDRFGTPLEKRFSKNEIEGMLLESGFTNICFSNNAPYWHVTARRP